MNPNSDKTVYECVSGIIKGRKFQWRLKDTDEWQTADGNTTFFQKMAEGCYVQLEPLPQEENADSLSVS